jgi:DNA-binding HxlR family transcriptional regulator
MKKEKDFRTCSVARLLMVLGDRWLFLILREAFFGVRYYDGFKTNLGIATNILSHRLKILTENGIMAKRTDPDDARRMQYRLTEKGLDLYPIILAMMQWGDKWLDDGQGPPLVLHHKACGHRLEPVMCCRHCGRPVLAADIEYSHRDDPEHLGAGSSKQGKNT